MATSLADLKALGVLLPGNEKLASGEVADVLSALVARLNHGDAILEAAKDGVVGIHQFYHDVIANAAQRNGDPQPEKGQMLTQPVPVMQPAAQAAQGIDYDKLAEAMIRAQAKATAPVEPAEEAVERPDGEGAIL